MRKGYLTPPIIIFLALVTLFVAGTIYVNSFFLKDIKQQPAPTPSPPEGKFCGGIAGNLPENQCPEGYKCLLDGNYPDASGKCVKK